MLRCDGHVDVRVHSFLRVRVHSFALVPLPGLALAPLSDHFRVLLFVHGVISRGRRDLNRRSGGLLLPARDAGQGLPLGLRDPLEAFEVLRTGSRRGARRVVVVNVLVYLGRPSCRRSRFLFWGHGVLLILSRAALALALAYLALAPALDLLQGLPLVLRYAVVFVLHQGLLDLVIGLAHRDDDGKVSRSLVCTPPPPERRAALLSLSLSPFPFPRKMNTWRENYSFPREPCEKGLSTPYRLR